MKRVGLRCWFTGFMFGWAVAIYASSAIVAIAGLSPHVAAPKNWAELPKAAFAVADWVSPGAKLTFGALFGAQLWLLRNLHGFAARLALGALEGAVAMLVTAFILPLWLSRGFGGGLAGVWLDPTPMLIYSLSGALAGLVAALQIAACERARTGDAPPRAR